MTANRMVDNSMRASVEEAVSSAEKNTSAEIVCAVATESGRYDRAESLCGLVFGMLGLVAANVLVGQTGEGSWTEGGPSLAWQSIAVLLGYLIGSFVASYVHSIRRILTTQNEMRAESERAAMHVFAAEGLHKTQGRGGILIYVSLYERRVIIEADSGVMSAAGQELLDAMRETATAELKKGRISEAFGNAVSLAAEKLESALPVQPADENELENQLLVFHPRP